MARGGMNIVKQAQLMQQKMLRKQAELEEMTIEAAAGGGVVKVVVTGKQKIQSLEIDKSVVDPEDVEMLQDLVLAAVNEGIQKSHDMVQAEMAKVTGGLNVPGLF